MPSLPRSQRSLAPCSALALLVGLADGSLHAPATAQELRPLLPRWLPERSLDASLYTGPTAPHAPLCLVLKLVDGCAAELHEQQLRGADARLAPLTRWLAAHPGARLRPYFAAFARAQLRALRQRGEQRSGRALAELEQFYFLELPPGTEAREALGDLLALAVVENAYVAPAAVPPGAAPLGDIAPETPDFSALQGYWSAAPIGVDVDYAWTIPGTRGAGLEICDLETGWDLEHEDLSAQPPGALIGAPQVDPFDTDHGTAVAGILVADDDAFGVRGMVPEARLRVASAATAAGYDLAGAILLAANALSEGDVLLIEQQAVGPNTDGSLGGQFGLVAPEIRDADFAAMQTATALGLHVLEIACNGLQNYDSDLVPAGHPELLQKFDLHQRDSGALLVGAAQSALPHERMWFSNYGRRVDAYAWGQNVATLGYDSIPGFSSAGDLHQRYIGAFGGTSSATPIVTGCVMALEGRHRLLYGETYPQHALRLLLRTTGTPAADPQVPLGRMPDLREQLSLLESGPRLASVLRGEQSGSRLGSSVAFAEDLDGDAWSDFWVGSAGTPGAGEGRVEARSGITNEVLWTRPADPGDEEFASSLVRLADRDGDGVAELALGASGGRVGSSANGYALVLSGAQGTELLRIEGDQQGSDFGAALAELGDLDGDGLSELAVGAPQYAAASGAAPASGRVQVHRGSDGALLWAFEGAPGERFGSALASTSDGDGDGWPDLAVGAPGAGDGGANRGALCLLSGAQGGLLWRVDGAAAGERLGAAVCRVGDLDQDGLEDLAVGAPGASLLAPGAGEVQWRSLASGALWQRSPSAWAGAALGSSLARVAGAPAPWPEVWAGAPQPDLVAPGRALRLSASGAVLDERRGLAAGDGFGSALSADADLNADGRFDLLVGAPAAAHFDGASAAGFAHAALGAVGPALAPGDAPLVSFGAGTPGCSGTHDLWATGLPRIGASSFAITCDAAPPGTVGFGMIGTQAWPEGEDPLALGFTFHLGLAAPESLLFFYPTADAGGASTAPLPIPLEPALIDQVVVLQEFWPWPKEPPACTPLPSVGAVSSSRGLAIRFLPAL